MRILITGAAGFLGFCSAVSLLKKKHISSYRINWEDKFKNIIAISNELNIGLDSIVFIDDSPFEVNLIAE